MYRSPHLVLSDLRRTNHDYLQRNRSRLLVLDSRSKKGQFSLQSDDLRQQLLSQQWLPSNMTRVAKVFHATKASSDPLSTVRLEVALSSPLR